MPSIDDPSLILTKERLQGWLPDISFDELEALKKRADELFRDDYIFGKFYAVIEGFGAIGDGVTNDTAAILAATNTANTLGLTLKFDRTKRYRVENLTIPAGTRWETGGATFVKTVNNATYAIRSSDNFYADYLKLEVTGGASNEAGIYLNGNNQ